MYGSRPNFTTQTPNGDIDYVLTYGIKFSGISTLQIKQPAVSDYLGIVFNIDMESFFSSSYSDISHMIQRSLTSGNQWSVKAYIDYMMEQFDIIE